MYQILTRLIVILLKTVQKIFKSQKELILENLGQKLGIKPKLISHRSPWQNGIAERWILSARTEVLNHAIVLKEAHLYRLLKEYVAYYNDDRCHLSLDRDSPSGRSVRKKTSEHGKVVSLPKLGGLQHRYEWRSAA
ncbi:MAG: transposase [Proteobacteria bacterium]|nr:transposase [Pseudomonadota bacterium]